jgi:hypothetical protein
MKITVKQIMKWNPCDEYSKSRVKKLIGKGKTPLEICDLEIPVPDIFWALFRDEIIPENDLHELACKFAERALKAERNAGREPHPDSWKAIKVKRQWLKGRVTDEELSAAGSAAGPAAASAALSAALSAARTAALSAAWSAADSATDSAAWSAARSAAWSAQLKIVKKELLKLEAANDIKM